MFDSTTLAVKLAIGMRYGPGKNMPTAKAGVPGDGVGYAPTSCAKFRSAASRVPSSSKAIVAVPCSCRA